MDLYAKTVGGSGGPGSLLVAGFPGRPSVRGSQGEGQLQSRVEFAREILRGPARASRGPCRARRESSGGVAGCGAGPTTNKTYSGKQIRAAPHTKTNKQHLWAGPQKRKLQSIPLEKRTEHHPYVPLGVTHARNIYHKYQMSLNLAPHVPATVSAPFPGD